MRKFIIAGFILAAVAVTVFSIGSFIMAQEQTPPESVTHDTSFGKVTFSHKGHIASGATCKDCHHMAETPVKQCESCHTADAKVSAKDAYHKNCIDCHKAKEKGPSGCMDCHKKG